MYSSSSFSRPSYSHSHSHPAHQGFSVAGMSGLSGSSTLQSPGLRGGALGGGSHGLGSSSSFASVSSLGESRSHYQSGYIMSVTQGNGLQQGGQRHDETPIVPTKAKLSHSLVGGSASDFGMDSMFESSRSRHRHRQPLADEDAPPTNSVNDIITRFILTTGLQGMLTSPGFEPSTSRNAFIRAAQPATPRASQTPQAGSVAQTLHLVVFGYPPDKYSSLGETTEAEQHPDISNCFRIGYNGDVLSGSWMIGVKWADPAQADSILGSAFVRSEYGTPGSPPIATSSPNNDVIMSSATSASIFPSASSRMSVDEPGFGTSTPSVGTPIRLAPSAAAFRKPGAGSPIKGVQGLPGAVGPSPSKGMLEQVGDLIFGW
ncbi:uncharacterized protein B0H18DRAFT_1010845 [Fomitopsis serialis]|uniref:uncharacterized protein n=1 Tax=Fomitopsis serialis TaxID=139415 RepID=UPI0020076D76|nr:uncharacterized protein B0H18DRAFT_1010845 [Neoantrodia serialis]KAH9924711.1 hypothetical protein B0H18DRAFT_1010845 [Neoantrodia serialis]